MRIAFFADAFPDVSVTFIINQVAGLLRRGHDVQVFAQAPGRSASRHPLDLEWSLETRTRYIGPPADSHERAFRALRVLGSTPMGSLLRALPPVDLSPEARSGRLFFAAASMLDRPRFDVIHCHFGPNGNVAVRLRRLGLLDAPIVTTFHGYDMRAGVASGGRCYDLLREEGDAFLSISGYNRGLLEAWDFPSTRIHDHPVGIEPDEFPFRGPRRDPDETLRLLTVANLVEVKGHVHLLEALAKLRERDATLRVDARFVGDGPERERLAGKCRDLGLTDVVTFVGALNQIEVRRELNWADLFVLPSLGEATPVALMEAQCVGLPVIGTKVGAVHEVVKDGESGWLVPAGSAEALAEAIRTAVSGRSMWQPMGTTGRDHVARHFAIEELLSRLESIYEGVGGHH